MRPKWTEILRYGHRPAAGHRHGRNAGPAISGTVRLPRSTVFWQIHSEAKAQRARCCRVSGDILRRGGYSGVHGAEVIPNCVDRDNRYDVLIRLDMDREALSLYDVSAMHHRWKDEFTPLLEKKAIFDHES